MLGPQGLADRGHVHMKHPKPRPIPFCNHKPAHYTWEACDALTPDEKRWYADTCDPKLTVVTYPPEGRRVLKWSDETLWAAGALGFSIGMVVSALVHLLVRL